MARVLSILAALALLGGACFAILVSGTWQWLACVNEGTEACAREHLAFAAFVLAIVGAVAPLTLAVAAVVGHKRLAAAAGAVGVPLYVTWAVVFDAAGHGWDELTLVP